MDSVEKRIAELSEREWFVMATFGDGGHSCLVPRSKLHEALHEEMCTCGKDWRECTTEGVREEVARLDQEDEWSREYPTYNDYRFKVDFEDGGIEFTALTEHPYAEHLDALLASERSRESTVRQCAEAVCVFCSGKHDENYKSDKVERIPKAVAKGYIPNFGEFAGGFVHPTTWGVPKACEASKIFEKFGVPALPREEEQNG